jgi:hypothetical protein
MSNLKHAEEQLENIAAKETLWAGALMKDDAEILLAELKRLREIEAQMKRLEDDGK